MSNAKNTKSKRKKISGRFHYNDDDADDDIKNEFKLIYNSCSWNGQREKEIKMKQKNVSIGLGGNNGKVWTLDLIELYDAHNVPDAEAAAAAAAVVDSRQAWLQVKSLLVNGRHC